MASVVTVTHTNTAGQQDHVILNIDNEALPRIHYLPNICNSTSSQAYLELTNQRDDDHSVIRLAFHAEYILVSVHQETEPCCFVSPASGEKIMIPPSSPAHIKSIILRDCDRITDQYEGSWSVRRGSDESQVVVGNAMAPPVPLFTRAPSFLSPVSNAVYTRRPLQQIDLNLQRLPSRPKRLTHVVCDIITSKTERDVGTLSSTLSKDLIPSESEEVAHSSVVAYKVEDHKISFAPIQSTPPKARNAENPEIQESEHENDSHSATGAKIVDIEAVVVDGSIENYRDTGSSPKPTRKRKRITYARKQSEVSRKRKKSTEIGSEVSEDADTITVAVSPTTTTTKCRHPYDDLSSLQPADNQPTHTTTPHSSPATPKGSLGSRGPGRWRRALNVKTGHPDQYLGPAPAVIFSSSTMIDRKTKALDTFKILGGRVVSSMMEATILCVSDEPLKKTSKLIMAVALGKDIVVEEWVAESQRRGMLLRTDLFRPKDPLHEREWKFSLENAIERGKAGLTGLLAGTVVYCTGNLRASLSNNYCNYTQIATILGADKVKNGIPTAKAEPASTLVIGTNNDEYGAEIARLGHKLYDKDVLTMAALRGRIEINTDEFVLQVPIKGEEMEEDQ